ncbi:MAG: hypothetical protein ACI4J7_09415 [Ruminiclostridium sp.]
MVVAFFGHKDTPSAVKPLLEQTVQRLIEENEEITFLVGTHGAFDLMAQSVLGQALQEYPHITCHIVLSYIPAENNGEQHPLPTLVPEGIESVPKRFAISFSNNYMVNECDTVVCYITHDWGGATQFVNKAEKKGKVIINLAEANLSQKTY